METAAKRLYEGMFLIDSAQAAADWDGTLAVVDNILKRADAEVVSMRKWGERRLAYEIDHEMRGTYILCYFKADGRRIAGIEKDVQLSEQVMRVLILGTEKRPPQVIEEDVAGAPRPEKAPEATTKSESPAAAAGKAESASPAAAAEEAGGASPATVAEEAESASPAAASTPEEGQDEARSAEPEGASEPEKTAE